MPATRHSETPPSFFAEPDDAEETIELIADYGDDAAGECERRALRSRRIGNVVHFCRWRRIGRLVGTLTRPEAGLKH